MELRHIRAFLAVAEEGGFTRAAARLGIAQPPLSGQIRQLEEEIGTILFRRRAHGAELSPAGIAFLAIVRDMPGLAVRGIQAAQRVGRGEAGAMTLGFTASSIFNLKVNRTIAAFRRTYPDVELRLEEANTRRLLEGLRERSVDAAFLRPGEADREDLVVMALHLEPMITVLPVNHSSAQAEAVALADLADEPLLLFPREIGPLLFDVVVAACREAGFEPRLGQTTPQIASIVHLVAAGLGVAIVPESMSQLGPKAVVFKPFREGGPKAPLAFARSKDDASPITLNFEAVVGENFDLKGDYEEV